MGPWTGVPLWVCLCVACSAPRMVKNVHFWGYFVIEAACIACRVPLCPAITWGLGSGVVGTNQPSLQGTTSTTHLPPPMTVTCELGLT